MKNLERKLHGSKNRLKDFVKTIPSLNFENTIDVDIVIPAKVTEYSGQTLLRNTLLTIMGNNTKEAEAQNRN